MDWSAVKTAQVHVVNSMEHPGGAQRIKPLIARMLSEDLSRMYLQFKSNCVHKQDMAEDVFRYWRSKGLDLPKMTRIQDPIIPAPDTIDVHGLIKQIRPLLRDRNDEQGRVVAHIARALVDRPGLHRLRVMRHEKL